MSSINQILNSALMESVLNEGDMGDKMQSKTGVNKKMQDEKIGKNDYTPTSRPVSAPDPDKFKDSPSETKYDGPSLWDKTKFAVNDFNYRHPDAWKYGAGATAALGAGLGALALAKKLRAKKAAAASKK